MDTVIIRLINQKAYKLLQDMEELSLIKILKEPAKLSSLRGQIQTQISNDDIDRQLDEMRKEW